MRMLKLNDFEDYEKLPLTKWNIKQPNAEDVNRENPMLTGDTHGFSYDYLLITLSFLSISRSIRLIPDTWSRFYSKRW